MDNILPNACTVNDLSSLTLGEAKQLIGKIVSRVVAEEYGITLYFHDASCLSISGARWDGCSLGIEYIPKGDNQ